jgi:hypothetical protein
MAIHQLLMILSTPPSGTFEYQYDSGISNGTITQSPVNIYYRRNIFQTVYTAAELSANGAVSGCIFTNLTWYITGAVPSERSVRGLNIRLFHTTTVDGTVTASPIGGETKITVYSVSDTTDVLEFESIGDAEFGFTAPFVWNGVNNICIESCTAQNEFNWFAAGTQRVFPITNGSRYSQDDNVGTSCSENPSEIVNFKPSVKMGFS